MRPPLNGFLPRTQHEACGCAYDWLEGPAGEVVDPRPLFERSTQRAAIHAIATAALPPVRRPSTGRVRSILLAAAIGLAAAVLLAWRLA